MWDDEYTDGGWEDIMDNPYLGTGTDYEFYEDREDELEEYRDELDDL